RNAGSVFLGPWTTEAFGDYAAGVNHVLPTGGSARFASGLGVLDFVRRSQVLAVGPVAAETLGAVSTVLARAEGLEAHARSIEIRRDGWPEASGSTPASASAPAPTAAPAPAPATPPPTAPPPTAPPSVSQTDVVNAARGVFSAWGYEDVAAPLFLPLDALEPGLKGLDLRDRLLKFVDPQGRVMVVRPDWTLAIAHQSVGALRSGSAALRLSYAGSVYRLGGRGAAAPEGGQTDWEAFRDSQVGVELFGEAAAWSDAELLAMAVESLERCGLDDFTICVGHAGLTEAMLAGLGADPAAAGAMRAALVRRDLVAWERLLGSPGIDRPKAAAARALIACRGGAGDLLVAPGDAFGPAVAESLESLSRLWSILEGSRPAWPVIFDLGLVRDLDYYTGVVFEAYAPGSGRPVLTGGRYDGLLSAFGLDRPAVGLAIDLEALARVLAAQGRMKADAAPPLRIAVEAGHESAAFARAAALRRDGFRVELRPVEARPVEARPVEARPAERPQVGGDWR
ncbi:MAG: ATP phosphoribosyltransferase regulatory subunit, partial [Bacillota bacterium]